MVVLRSKDGWGEGEGGGGEPVWGRLGDWEGGVGFVWGGVVVGDG